MIFNSKIKLTVVLALVLALGGLNGACRTPAGRTTGNVVDDATITTKVKAKIIGEDKLKGFGINVDTFQGEVTLTGAVDTVEDKQQAEEIANSVDGVKKVNNLLQIKDSEGKTGRSNDIIPRSNKVVRVLI